MMDQPRSRWFRSLNGDGRYGVALLGFAASLLLPALRDAAGQQRWQYQRLAITAGEWWRLCSCHFVHLGARHALFNVAGLCLLWALFARHFRPSQWLIVLLCSMATVDLGLWYLQPRVSWYLGASGVLHGLWAAGACAECRRGGWQSWLPLAALLAKLSFEHATGASAVISGMPVVLSSHLYGAIGGAAVAIAIGFATAPPRRSL
jgi:rhomboid family GlyGly-CTERM serine protease